MAAPRNDNVKEKILDAATGLLNTQTFADISLAEIAAAAGVSKGTLYYHYKNKTDILFGITNRYLDRQWDDLIAWTENKDKDTSVHRLVKYVVERNTASAEAVVRVCRRRISLCDREKNEVSAPDTSAETHSSPNVTAHSTAIWPENPLNAIHEAVLSKLARI